MNFLLVIDHPNQNSFNYQVMHHFIKGIQANQHTFDICDLEKDQFNPVMSIKDLEKYAAGGFTDENIESYQRQIMSADYLVFFFPVWWIAPPARLKGWMDKVLLPNFAFTEGQIPQPLLSHIQKAIFFTTTGVSDDVFQKEFGSAFRLVFDKGVFQFCGIQDMEWFNCGDVGFASRQKHTEWLTFVQSFAEKF
jgi:NAD(P)H dehydrogenase (quinone)